MLSFNKIWGQAANNTLVVIISQSVVSTYVLCHVLRRDIKEFQYAEACLRSQQEEMATPWILRIIQRIFLHMAICVSVLLFIVTAMNICHQTTMNDVILSGVGTLFILEIDAVLGSGNVVLSQNVRSGAIFITKENQLKFLYSLGAGKDIKLSDLPGHRGYEEVPFSLINLAIDFYPMAVGFGFWGYSIWRYNNNDIKYI